MYVTIGVMSSPPTSQSAYPLYARSNSVARPRSGSLDMSTRAAFPGMTREAAHRGGTVYDEFHVEIHHRGANSCEVTVAGELDVGTAPELRAALHWA